LEPVIPWEVRRLLLLWTRTRVWDGADRARVLHGVPHGTATSPLLANFYLTSFDRQLDDDGVHPVRYVDDLAALARTEHKARAALNTMETALQPLGLALNPAGDPVRHFDQGFEFLGFELRGRLLRVAPSKLLEFRRHAVEVQEAPGAGPMRRRIALLNRMVRDWRAYYRMGIPREQFRELDTWLEERVRAATLRLWSRDGARGRDLELAGLESLAGAGRRIFQPEPPPSVEGYGYRIPVEGADPRADVAVAGAGDALRLEGGACVVEPASGGRVRLRPGLRAVVVADGALCDAAALRHLLEHGTALRFVALVVPAPGPTAVGGEVRG
jgi:hypothetical protein